MNDLCYEYFQDDVCLNSFDCVVVHKKRLGAQTRVIKDRLRYINKKIITR